MRPVSLGGKPLDHILHSIPDDDKRHLVDQWRNDSVKAVSEGANLSLAEILSPASGIEDD
jgi:hypothetical protein